MQDTGDFNKKIINMLKLVRDEGKIPMIHGLMGTKIGINERLDV